MTVPKPWNIGIHAAQSYLPNEQLLFCYAFVTLQILSGYCLVTGIFSWFGVTDLFGTFKRTQPETLKYAATRTILFSARHRDDPEYLSQ